MTGSSPGGQQSPRIISDKDHVAHYCSPQRVVNGLPSGNAFELREGRDTYLSVDWLEILDPGDTTTAIQRLRPILAEKIAVSPNGRLAVPNVGEARQAARQRGSRTLRVVHRPEVDRESHAGIENYGTSRAQHLRVAAALRDLVRRCCMHDAVA